MSTILLEGKNLALEIKEEIKKELIKLKEEKNIIPLLTAISIGKNPASLVYINQQRKTCEKIGINYDLKELPYETKEEKVIELIKKLNNDSKITGIIIQLPLPSHIDARKIRSEILWEKDVEGVTPYNMGLVTYGQLRLAPCTALAVIELIKSTNVELYGKEVTIIGHSDIVGKPIALFLLEKFATVTICHIGTKDISFHVKRAEILIVAVGKANLIKGNLIKEGAIVIDVGINKIKDKIIGDVEFEEASKRASFITPVPGGVGPLTVIMLLKNTLEAIKWQKEK